MDFIHHIIYSWTLEKYYCFLLLFTGIYEVILAPIIFRFWIIPKIENRYGIILKFDSPAYRFDWSAFWIVPPIEISFYIYCTYMGWFKIRKKKYSALGKINYDIQSASRAEIIMCWITLLNIAILFSGIIWVAFEKIFGKW
jgi:hypothetical protein